MLCDIFADVKIMDIGKDIKMFGGLMLALFMVIIIVGVTYVGADYFKETLCENAGTAYVWQAETCYESATNLTEVPLTSITKINIVEGVISTALGLLTLVVLMGIFSIVVRLAKGFGKDF